MNVVIATTSRRRWILELIPTFFGLSPNYKPILHNQIFELVYYGKGGFNWNDIYNMPVWLRNFYYKKIDETLTKQKKAQEAKTQSVKKPKINRPAI